MSRKLNTGNMALLTAAAKRAGSMFGVDETRSYREVDIDLLEADPEQPRRNFDEAALQELADSFKDVGVLQPLVVQERTAGRYTIIAGERRWRAARLAALPVLPVMVLSEDVDPRAVALIENLQRQDLDPIEEARALSRLGTDGMTQEDLGRVIGKSQVYVARSLALLQLPANILETYNLHREISASALRTIADVHDEALQQAMWTAALDGATVRQLEAMKAPRGGRTPPSGNIRGARSTFSHLVVTFARVANKSVGKLKEQRASGSQLKEEDRRKLEEVRAAIDELLA